LALQITQLMKRGNKKNAFEKAIRISSGENPSILEPRSIEQVIFPLTACERSHQNLLDLIVQLNTHVKLT